MCEQCLTNPISFGEVIPGWILMRARRDGNDWKKGEWGLVQCNDPTFRWSLTPTPSPVWKMSDDEEDAWFETVAKDSPEYHRAMYPFGIENDGQAAYDDFTRNFFECGADVGYDLIVSAKQVGYDPDRDGFFAYWFFDYIGEYLKTAEIREEGDPFPQREKFSPTDYTIGRQ